MEKSSSLRMLDLRGNMISGQGEVDIDKEREC